MSILRIGILVAIVIAVLPADEEQQARLYDHAATAVHWTATFCDRNGTTCEKAGDVWASFVKKARFGAQMAYEMALKYSKSDSSYFAPASAGPEQGTLTPHDLRPAWRGSSTDI
jgi:Family of unknown function (DUF5330)